MRPKATIRSSSTSAGIPFISAQLKISYLFFLSPWSLWLPIAFTVTAWAG